MYHWECKKSQIFKILNHNISRYTITSLNASPMHDEIPTHIKCNKLYIGTIPIKNRINIQI